MLHSDSTDERRSSPSSLEWSIPSQRSSSNARASGHQNNSRNSGRPPQHSRQPTNINNTSGSNSTMELDSRSQLPMPSTHIHAGGLGGLSGSMAQHYPSPQQQQPGLYRPQRPRDPQSQQQHNIQNHDHNHQQVSPSFQQRSSPIAIIRNPEDSADHAKVRYQHPMYDSSEDELDDDDLFHSSEGISVESLTSNHTRSSSRGSQSLPTNLLRAPKLGSLPSREYLLHHLTTLPPPMSLNNDAYDGEDDATPAELSNSFREQPSQLTRSTRTKPTYLSSYGSLRESHLTGRFGGQPTAASTGNLHDNMTADSRKVHFQHETGEPSSTLGTLIPPQIKVAVEKLQSKTVDQQQHYVGSSNSEQPQQSLSIRDRMMQKAQQQKEHETEQEKFPASSLSAILEQRQQQRDMSANNTQYYTTKQTGCQPAQSTSSELSSGLAQTVTVSYNSNLSLLHNSNPQNNDQLQQSSLGSEERTQEMLSSSVTGLEILRAANRKKNGAPFRPRSLDILQGNNEAGGLVVSPPPVQPPGSGDSNSSNVTREGHYFPLLARANSEPLQWASDPTGTGDPSRQMYAPTKSLSASSRQGPFESVNTAGTLIPPRTAVTSWTGPQTAAMSMSVTTQQQATCHPEEGIRTTAQSNAAYAMSYLNETHHQHHHQAQVEDHNPDTEGAFDMDLE